MIYGILGKPGCGKTLFGVSMVYWHWKGGFKIYSKSDLRLPFLKIDNLDDLYDIDIEQKALIFYDELWMDFDSRKGTSNRSERLSKFILQVRKKSKEEVVFLYTAQLEHTFDKRLRGITDAYYKPNITQWVNENGKQVPVLMSVEYYDSNMLTRNFNWSIYGYHKLYDTNEEQDIIAEVDYNEVVKKYHDAAYTLTKNELKSLLVHIEKLSDETAGRIADYVKACVKMEKAGIDIDSFGMYDEKINFN